VKIPIAAPNGLSTFHPDVLDSKSITTLIMRYILWPFFIGLLLFMRRSFKGAQVKMPLCLFVSHRLPPNANALFDEGETIIIDPIELIAQ
jgi:hypothetical protein